MIKKKVKGVATIERIRSSCNLAQLATLQASKGDLDCRRRKIMCQSASGSNYFPIQDTISYTRYTMLLTRYL